jgi:hypothetical protein
MQRQAKQPAARAAATVLSVMAEAIGLGNGAPLPVL